MKTRIVLLSALLFLGACSETNVQNEVIVTADQWSQAELWCRGLEGVNSVRTIQHYEWCGRGCGYVHTATSVIAQCRTGQYVSQRFSVTRKN